MIQVLITLVSSSDHSYLQFTFDFMTLTQILSVKEGQDSGDNPTPDLDLGVGFGTGLELDNWVIE